MHNRVAISVLAFLLLCLVPATAAWRKVSIGNLEVYSEISTSQTEELLDDMHRFREALRLMFPKMQENLDLDLEGRPIRIIFLKDKKTLHSVLPLYRDKPKPASGLFSPGPGYDMIWVDARRPAKYVRKTLFHEFTHVLLRKDPYVPLALEEGLAEFFSEIQFEDDLVTLGTPDKERLASLSVQRQIPPHELLTMGHGSRNYNHIGVVGSFYDQAWLMMDYILCGQAPSEVTASFWFVINAARMGSRDQGFASLAAGLLPDLGLRIKDYYNRGQFQLLRMKIDELPEPPPLKFQKVSKAEMQSVLAAAQAMAGRIDEARETFTRLQKKFKRDSQPFQEAAIIEFRYGNLPAARASANTAIANGATAPLLQAIVDSSTEE